MSTTTTIFSTRTTVSSLFNHSTPNLLQQSSNKISPKRLRSSNLKCRASSNQYATSNSSDITYQGVYGPWRIEKSDIQEVILYRSGLVTAASSFVICSSSAFFRDSAVFDWIRENSDLFYALGSCGLGLSLYLIHIYVTEIKRALQFLWVVGALGSLGTYLGLAHPLGKSLVEYVAMDNATAVWFVGPMFAALTGLVFKEGLCYGKLEAAALTFIIPSLLLGHLSGLMDENTKLALLGVWMGLFVVFAARKFTQPIKDDIGDKSVFMFNALPEEEKAALFEKLEQNQQQQNLD